MREPGLVAQPLRSDPLGVAHAIRLPEEVVLVREETGDDSTDDLPFDLLHIRYQTFDPADPEGAAERIAALLTNALAEIDRTREFIVDKTLRSIDDDSADLIRDHYEAGVFNPWREASEGGPGELYQRFVAPRLLDLGVLKAESHPDWGVGQYRFTELGQVVGARLGSPGDWQSP